jgi:hypothetical protein
MRRLGENEMATKPLAAGASKAEKSQIGNLPKSKSILGAMSSQGSTVLAVIRRQTSWVSRAVKVVRAEGFHIPLIKSALLEGWPPVVNVRLGPLCQAPLQRACPEPPMSPKPKALRAIKMALQGRTCLHISRRSCRQNKQRRPFQSGAVGLWSFQRPFSRWKIARSGPTLPPP